MLVSEYSLQTQVNLIITIYLCIIILLHEYATTSMHTNSWRSAYVCIYKCVFLYNFSMFKFSKIKYLKLKWGMPSLSQANLEKHNKYIKSIVWRVMVAELRIEQYVYETLNSAWNNKSLTTKCKKDILKMPNRYKIKMSGNQFQSSLLMAVKNKMTVGDKIIIWKGMNKTQHPDKFDIFDKNVIEKEMVNILENLRNIRNSIAHFESLISMFKNLRILTNNRNEELVRETLRKLGV